MTNVSLRFEAVFLCVCVCAISSCRRAGFVDVFDDCDAMHTLTLLLVEYRQVNLVARVFVCTDATRSVG
jgi:hypothetical protein